MSRGNKKKTVVEIPHKNKIEEVNKILHRLLKNNKLQGLFTVFYKPLKGETLKNVSDEVSSLRGNVVINSHRVSVEGYSDFKKKLRALVGIVLNSRVDKRKMHPKVNPELLVSLFFDHYFNENKDKYRLRINHLDFANAFGLIFVFIGLLIFSSMSYFFFGFIFVISFLLTVGVMSSIFLCRL